MSRKLRVAFIISSLEIGGLENATVTRINNLPNSHFANALIYLKKVDHVLPRLKAENCRVWCPNFKKGWDFHGVRRLAALMNEFQPDILLCANQYPLFYAFLARLLSKSKPKLLASFHSTALPKREDRQMRYFYRFFFNRCVRVIFVSFAQREYWTQRGLRADTAVVIHNGVDTKYFTNNFVATEISELRGALGFSNDDFVIGISAALRPEKHHEDLLEAVARLKSKGVPAKCLIVGDGPRRAAVEARTSELELESDVMIVGFQNDVRPYLAACDCVALVSHSVEAFSNAALEGMAMGKPVVLSEVGGAAEQVCPGVNGYLFPAGDVKELALALGNLVDPVRRAAFGNAGRSRAQRLFSLDVMIKKYSELLLCGLTDNKDR